GNRTRWRTFMLGYGPTASASSTVSSPRATPTPMRWIAPSGAPNGCSRDSRCRDMPDSTRVPLIGLSPHGQQALFGLAAFRGLGEAERRDVAGLLREIAVEKGETVYRAGEDADALYIVASGAVDVLDGKQLIARYGLAHFRRRSRPGAPVPTRSSSVSHRTAARCAIGSPRSSPREAHRRRSCWRRSTMDWTSSSPSSPASATPSSFTPMAAQPPT